MGRNPAISIDFNEPPVGPDWGYFYDALQTQDFWDEMNDEKFMEILPLVQKSGVMRKLDRIDD